MAPSQSNLRTPPRTLSNQLKYSAPIPLVPEKDPKANKMNKIKVKLRLNPNSNRSEVAEKEYVPFQGTTVEGYCNFHRDLAEYIRGAAGHNAHLRIRERFLDSGPLKSMAAQA